MHPVPIKFVADALIGGAVKTEYERGEKPGKPGLHYRRDLPPGAAYWDMRRETVPFLHYTCPCGCGVIGDVPAIAKGVITSINGWEWNGDFEKPTLAPSIKRMFGCGWHGFLTDGVWLTC